jgi:hypothetical protein
MTTTTIHVAAGPYAGVYLARPSGGATYWHHEAMPGALPLSTATVRRWLASGKAVEVPGPEEQGHDDVDPAADRDGGQDVHEPMGTAAALPGRRDGAPQDDLRGRVRPAAGRDGPDHGHRLRSVDGMEPGAPDAHRGHHGDDGAEGVTRPPIDRDPTPRDEGEANWLAEVGAWPRARRVEVLRAHGVHAGPWMSKRQLAHELLLLRRRDGAEGPSDRPASRTRQDDAGRAEEEGRAIVPPGAPGRARDEARPPPPPTFGVADLGGDGRNCYLAAAGVVFTDRGP